MSMTTIDSRTIIDIDAWSWSLDGMQAKPTLRINYKFAVSLLAAQAKFLRSG